MTALELRETAKSFGGVRAVDGCSFKIERAKITALIGPNGAGKTTVFNLINGFVILDRGKIIFEGREVNRLSVWERSRLGMSRTFQLSRLFRNLSIRENLELAVRGDDDRFFRMFVQGRKENEYDEKIREVMKFVGLNKPLGTSVTDLSYGEQKLFDLVRALLNPHTILLLDEPVAGVNPVLRKKLGEILVELKQQGETILLIEHDIDFVRNVADWVIVMDQGRVLTEGLPAKVVRDKAVLEAYLGAATGH